MHGQSSVAWIETPGLVLLLHLGKVAQGCKNLEFFMQASRVPKTRKFPESLNPKP